MRIRVRGRFGGRFGRIRVDSGRFGSIRGDSGRVGTIRGDSGRFGPIRNDSGGFATFLKGVIKPGCAVKPGCCRRAKGPPEHYARCQARVLSPSNVAGPSQGSPKQNVMATSIDATISPIRRSSGHAHWNLECTACTT